MHWERENDVTSKNSKIYHQCINKCSRIRKISKILLTESKIEANEHITRFMRFFYKVLTEALELGTGGGGGIRTLGTVSHTAH